MRTFLFFFRQLPEDNFLRDKINFLIWWGTFELNEESSTKVTSSDATHLLKLFFIAYVIVHT